jgi:hypothetical protein
LPRKENHLEYDHGHSTMTIWVELSSAPQTLEIARQITVVDHLLFSRVPVHELYDKAWSENRSLHAGDRLRAFIDRSV